MEASRGSVICLTLYYTHHLGALEKVAKWLLLMTKATASIGTGSVFKYRLHQLLKCQGTIGDISAFIVSSTSGFGRPA